MHYCIRLPGGEMVRLVFKFVLGSFSGGEQRAFYSKSLIIVLQKLRHNLGFLDTTYRVCASVSIVSQRFCETLDLTTTRLEWIIK